MTLNSFYSRMKVLALLSLATLASCNQNLTQEQSWIYACLVGLGISLLGFVAALLIVCIKNLITQTSFTIFVNMLYSLGCGAIIGDAVIHIIPDAYKDEKANSQILSLIFICSIVFFLVLERLFQALGVAHHHWGQDHQHHHHHQHSQIHDLQELHEPHDHEYKTTQHNPQIQKVKSKTPKLQQAQQQISCLQSFKGKGSAGYLNLMSSFIHNFFDGFAIGVGFASMDPHIYIPVMIAIICHEIPRQMGDVGILIKSGFTGIQTILCNGIINLMSLAGVIPGLLLGGISSEIQHYIMIFVAGNFIYIGADIWRNLLRNKLWIENMMELLMFFFGVGAMFLVLLVQEDK